MHISKSHRYILAITFGGLLSLNMWAPPSLANNTASSEASQGLPGRRLGGGTRGPEQTTDLAEYMPLMAVMPETNLGITTAAHPRFLFYLPVSNSVRTVEYVLRNEADELVYETTFSVSSTSGFVSIDLADANELSALTLNENYHWYFSIVADDRAQDISVDGWTRRVTLATWIEEQSLDSDLEVRLSSSTPLEQARILYREAALWHDAALILEELQQKHPQDEAVMSEWSNLLQTANLPVQELSTTNPVIVAAPMDIRH